LHVGRRRFIAYTRFGFVAVETTLMLLLLLLLLPLQFAEL
jgi:hypothetical protein